MEARTIERESVAAILPTDEQYANQQSQQIVKEVEKIKNQADLITIKTDADYESAALLGQEIRRKTKFIQGIFTPIKQKADQAHKEAVQQERTLLKPLKEAENAIKVAMGRYTFEKEQAAARAAEQARLETQRLTEQMLEKAEQLESAGETDLAEDALREAQLMNESVPAVSLNAAAPKVKGVSQRTEYTFTIVDPEKVPIIFNGMTLRPIDESAVMRLVKASKGEIKIPGITVQVSSKTILRS